jgi:hypothetical protein
VRKKFVPYLVYANYTPIIVKVIGLVAKNAYGPGTGNLLVTTTDGWGRKLTRIERRKYRVSDEYDDAWVTTVSHTQVETPFRGTLGREARDA